VKKSDFWFKMRKIDFSIRSLRSGAALSASCAVAQVWSTALTVDFSLTFDFLTVYAPGTHFQ
jgi:hypothetical protein